MIKLYFFLSIRYLRSKQKDRFISMISWFSFIGIVLGVTTLIVVTSVMNGFRAELLSKVLSVTGDIVVVPNTENKEDINILKQNLKKLPYIKEVWGYVEGQALTIHNQEAIGLMIRGVNPNFFKKNQEARTALKNGNLHSLLIGKRLQQKLNLSLGQNLTLISPNFSTTLFGSIPRITSYPVSGVFQFKMYQYDSSLIYMPLDDAKKFLNKQHIDAFSIYVNNRNNIIKYSRLLNQLPNVLVAEPWGNSNQTFFETIQVEKNVMFIILTLIVIVAAFNIISGQVMFVKDHMGNVAILKSLGASRSFIMKIFFITGSFVGIAGTIVGTLLGILLSLYLNDLMDMVESLFGVNLFHAEVYYLSSLPTKIYISDIIFTMLMTLLITFIAALYPAYRASKLDPSLILRHE